MKIALLSTAILIMILLASGELEPIVQYSFQTDMDRNTKGLSFVQVGFTSKLVSLTGEIDVAEREVFFDLASPQWKSALTCNLSLSGSKRRTRIAEFYNHLKM
jgi:hypothetical protein